MQPLDAWLARQYRYSADAMVRSISATGVVKQRPGFGTQVRAAPGSIVASTVLASYDPDPDYFFHWFRDSAIIIDALRLLYQDGTVGASALTQLGEFVRFSRALAGLDGGELVRQSEWRARVSPGFVQYLRADTELARAQGQMVSAETRVNPDGTLDISSWARPQYDGPSLRALALLRWHELPALQPGLAAELALLVRDDLALTCAHWRDASFDIWEEERGAHYYTLRVAAAALRRGAQWLQSLGERPLAAHYAEQSDLIERQLDGFWSEQGFYRSRQLEGGAPSSKELDIAVILAAVHTEGEAAHSVHDPRMQATLERLQALFIELYPINQTAARRLGPAMGRYAGDHYYSGGAYYFSTLGAAEFCFKAARGAQAQRWMARGEAFLDTVRAYTPDSGELSEQFDQRSGEQSSAKHLAWSYAALISCVAARRRAQAPK